MGKSNDLASGSNKTVGFKISSTLVYSLVEMKVKYGSQKYYKGLSCTSVVVVENCSMASFAAGNFAYKPFDTKRSLQRCLAAIVAFVFRKRGRCLLL